MLGFEAAAYAELPGMNYRASWKKSMECVQDGESKIQDHMPKWLFDPWVWMWWNSISNISRHWDQNDQNIIQLKSKEIPHTAVIPTVVLFDCQTVHIWDIIKWTLHEKRFVACIMFASGYWTLWCQLFSDISYCSISGMKMGGWIYCWYQQYLMDAKMLNRWSDSIFNQYHQYGASGPSIAHWHLSPGNFFAPTSYFDLQKLIRNKLKQGNVSATFVSFQNSKAGEPPAPTRTSSTTATTPEAFNSDLVKTDNSETSSEKHEGSPSQPENDEVKKSTAPTRVPIWGPGFPWGPFSVFGSPKGPHFHYFRPKNVLQVRLATI